MLLHLALALPAPRAEEFNAPLVALAMPEPPPLARDNSHWQRRLFAAPANATVPPCACDDAPGEDAGAGGKRIAADIGAPVVVEGE